MGGGTLEKVIDGGANNDSVLVRVDGEAADFDAVAAGNVLDHWGLADNLDELLASVSVLVDVANVTRGDGLRERDVDGEL